MVLKALALSFFAVPLSAGALLAGIVAAGGHAADTTTTRETTITETAPGDDDDPRADDDPAGDRADNRHDDLGVARLATTSLTGYGS